MSVSNYSMPGCSVERVRDLANSPVAKEVSCLISSFSGMRRDQTALLLSKLPLLFEEARNIGVPPHLVCVEERRGFLFPNGTLMPLRTPLFLSLFNPYPPSERVMSLMISFGVNPLIRGVQTGSNGLILVEREPTDFILSRVLSSKKRVWFGKNLSESLLRSLDGNPYVESKELSKDLKTFFASSHASGATFSGKWDEEVSKRMRYVASAFFDSPDADLRSCSEQAKKVLSFMEKVSPPPPLDDARRNRLVSLALLARERGADPGAFSALLDASPFVRENPSYLCRKLRSGSSVFLAAIDGGNPYIFDMVVACGADPLLAASEAQYARPLSSFFLRLREGQRRDDFVDLSERLLASLLASSDPSSFAKMIDDERRNSADIDYSRFDEFFAFLSLAEKLLIETDGASSSERRRKRI